MTSIKKGVTLNNYTLVEKLGGNQLGETFLGEQRIYEQGGNRSITKQYTIKTINLNLLEQLGLDPLTLEKEVDLLKKISETGFCSKYMPCYYDSFVHRTIMQDETISFLVIVSDYVVGVSLREIILEQTPKGNFDTSKLIQAMIEICQAVEYIHTQGIAHQNIKPSNIIFNSATRRFILIDFSFSCSVNLNSQCKGKTGTIYYSPPELLATTDPSQLPFSYRTAHDVWSMGVVFYQMANLGHDYINFTSNDPKQQSKEIQLGPINPSKYPFTPINNIINKILDKDPSKRPTAGEVLIMLNDARPLCTVNDKSYNRQVTKAIVESLGINVPREINDFELCNILSDHLQTCKIGNNEYQKAQLIELAKILGIDIKPDSASSEMCKLIQSGMQFDRDDYKKHVTEDLIHSVELMTKLVYEDNQEVLDKLTEHYISVYNVAKELELIDTKLLRNYQNEISRKSLVYTTNIDERIGEMYATIAKAIADIISDN